ncbi:lysophospholipid acyltransferase family protein [Pseudoxanthomonas sp. JBR18]|uniref:lysophospholipid acyltransferase family protein n=1 Tax=Pseudoxanthomonas sp. JBR18 TaxID=2969308 RepID=UPI0023064E12|nr:lysophospholipid acyltransferase family protein [Pseudoxanthomonas sp. JBR18]WCE06088.1 lysophospholipid acyltransferase family protein [Pseudoxanthomonas sp. JBR18]
MSTPSPALQSSGPGRAFRYFLRSPLLVVHLVVMLPLLLLTMVPLWAGLPVAGRTFKQFSVEHWSAALMRIFGFRLRRSGTPLKGAVMFVSNHVSWVDIEMMHSQRMVGFVAKQEIAGWPVVGWLAQRGETIFHQRGSTESLGGVMEAMLERLREGRPVAVFPEGRTRDGTEVGPFHARIFQPAVEAAVPVQPVALRYGDGGEAQQLVAFGPHESFFANFLRLLGEPSRVADICFLEPIYPDQVQGRRQIAETARARIVAVMGA